jgi:hypothetical protein
VQLVEDTREHKARSIGMDTDGKIRIKVFENRSGGEAAFKFFERGLTDRGPLEMLAFPKKGWDGGGDGGISFNEMTIRQGCRSRPKEIFLVSRSPNHS